MHNMLNKTYDYLVKCTVHLRYRARWSRCATPRWQQELSVCSRTTAAGVIYKRCSVFADEQCRKKKNISAPVLYRQLMPCGIQSMQDAEEWLRVSAREDWVSSSHCYSRCKMQIVLDLHFSTERDGLHAGFMEWRFQLFYSMLNSHLNILQGRQGKQKNK